MHVTPCPSPRPPTGVRQHRPVSHVTRQALRARPRRSYLAFLHPASPQVCASIGLCPVAKQQQQQQQHDLPLHSRRLMSSSSSATKATRGTIRHTKAATAAAGGAAAAAAGADVDALAAAMTSQLSALLLGHAAAGGDAAAAAAATASAAVDSAVDAASRAAAAIVRDAAANAAATANGNGNGNNDPVGDSVVCSFCMTAVQYIKIALESNSTIEQVGNCGAGHLLKRADGVVHCCMGWYCTVVHCLPCLRSQQGSRPSPIPVSPCPPASSVPVPSISTLISPLPHDHRTETPQAGASPHARYTLAASSAPSPLGTGVGTP